MMDMGTGGRPTSEAMKAPQGPSGRGSYRSLSTQTDMSSLDGNQGNRTIAESTGTHK